MTEPTGSEIVPDTDAAEDFAGEIGVDPTQDEITHYQRLEGEAPDETVGADPEPADPSVS